MTDQDQKIDRTVDQEVDRQVCWRWQGVATDIGVTVRGTGPTVLMLPALSSISTRREMGPLQQRLAARFRTVAVDWPGFGDLPRPAVDWTPQALASFLAFVLDDVAPRPHAVIAAGHASGYALSHACDHPGGFERLVLIAPTWRGPLPTMMGGHRPWFDRLRRTFDVPVLGAVLYGLNLNRLVVRYMAAGHVYADPAWLTPERLQQKLAVTRSAGARYASVRFVTGALDPLASRDAFLDRARRADLPILTVYGAETPSRSRAEIEALVAGVSAMASAVLPFGKLSVYEEFPDAVASAILPFLAHGT